MFRSASLAIICLAFSATSFAKLFRNSFVSFQLPPNWSCRIEQAEWVCTSLYNRRGKEATIILTSKERNPSDNLPAFKAHVSLPRTIPKPGGGFTKSSVLQVKERQIAGWQWVDGMQMNSEVQDFYTRYLATVKDRISILVTFSADKRYYTKYSQDFMNAIESLRVVARKDILSHRPNLAVRPGSGTIGAPIGNVLPGTLQANDYPNEDSSGFGGFTTKLIGLLLILTAVGIYLYMKSRKKKGNAPPKKRKK